MKKVSIIVPVYNVEKYLDKCLKSLVNQTLEDIEVIIINDGSTDDSQIIIDKYTVDYPDKVRSFFQKNAGQGEARNFGIEKATGEYIAFVDSDDYVDSNMYKLLYQKAKAEDLDIVLCDNYNVYEKGRAGIRQSLYDTDNHLFDKPAVWNKIYKAELIKKNNIKFRKKVWYEDLDFTFKIYTLTDKVGYIKESLYNYLLRRGSTMNNDNISRNREIFLAFDEIIKYSRNNDSYQKIAPIIEYLAIENIYIATIVRVINASSYGAIKQNINCYLDYMNTNFTNYKNNKYIYKLSFKQKVIFKLIQFKMYIILKLIFKVKR